MNIWKGSAGVLFNFTKNDKLTHCWTFKLSICVAHDRQFNNFTWKLPVNSTAKSADICQEGSGTFKVTTPVFKFSSPCSASEVIYITGKLFTLHFSIEKTGFLQLSQHTDINSSNTLKSCQHRKFKCIKIKLAKLKHFTTATCRSNLTYNFLNK